MNIAQQPLWNLRYAFRFFSQQAQGQIGHITVLGAIVEWDEQEKTVVKIPSNEIEKLAHAAGIAKDKKSILKPGFTIAVARTIEEVPTRPNDDDHMLMISHLSEFNAATYQQVVSRIKPARLSISCENKTPSIEFAGYNDIGPASVNGTTVRHLQRADIVPAVK